MGKGIILGIDFSIDFTQMAVLDDEINPRSISIGTEDNFLIPSVVCYNSELNEWSAGDEAVNKSRLNNSTEYRKLPEILKQNYGEDLTKQIITTPNATAAWTPPAIRCSAKSPASRLCSTTNGSP